MNLTVNAKQKLVVNTQKKMRKECKYNTEERYQTTRIEQREERDREELEKQPENGQQNDNKYIFINNYFTCKWTKSCNQKI